jgi:hypothetical protein
MHVRESDGLEWCGDLPEFEPVVGAWTKIQKRRTRVVWTRRARSAAVLLMLAALPLAWWLQTPEAPGIAANNPSDSELLAARDPELASNEGVRLLEAQLARVDRDLQSGYDLRVSSTELDELWRARHELEGALLVAYRRPQQLVAL